ncbi:MAG TPA: hypothetical protein PKH51_05050 [Candidatus Sumerlaeota bacterium]|nr:hypothetical protein [Candidatus Sumerlaeota bacterium]
MSPMPHVLCELTLPAAPESLVAFEELAQGLIAAHPRVLHEQRTAIRLAVDVVARRALGASTGGQHLRLVSLGFSTNSRSIQQLTMTIRCDGAVMTKALSLKGAEFASLKLMTNHRLQVMADRSGGIRAKLSRIPRIASLRAKENSAAVELSEKEIERLRESLWIYMLAKAWKRVEFHAHGSEEAIIRLTSPRVPDNAPTKKSA